MYVVAKAPNGFQVLKEVRVFRRLEQICFVPAGTHVDGVSEEQIAHRIAEGLGLLAEKIEEENQRLEEEANG
jgi:hypothetical protein